MADPEGVSPMSVKARFDGSVFVPEGPVNLPVGTLLEIPDVPAPPEADDAEIRPLAKLLEIVDMFPENPDLPTDYAAQHDHYRYGTPKKP
ncbi:hypothetical protein BH23PLA1_BH23PLA1_24790 [soil metagenome]